jgi:hypothetical protein
MDWLQDFLKYLGWTEPSPGHILHGLPPFPRFAPGQNLYAREQVFHPPEWVTDFLKRAAQSGPLSQQTLGFMLRRLSQLMNKPGAMNTILGPITPDMIRQILSQISPQG